jgi:hypothetical protein
MLLLFFWSPELSGSFILDWTVPQCLVNPGKRGQANKCLTLHACLAIGHRGHS